MLLYGSLFSPFVRKVALAAAEKGIAYEMGKGGVGAHTPEFLAASPFGKIPAISDGDYSLSDSTAIVAYLDAKVPTPALIPSEPKAYGRAIWFDEFADTIFGTSGLKIVFNRLVGPKLLKLPYDEAIALQGEAEMPRILDYFESIVPADGWLLGDFSIADISIASMFRTLAYIGHGPDAAKYPKTAAWYDRVCARPAWQAVAAQEAPTAERIGLLV